jgi:hypothetical protein
MGFSEVRMQYLVLLSAMDLALLELEKRLFHYPRQGPEIIQIADEGLVLAARAKARLRQTLGRPARRRPPAGGRRGRMEAYHYAPGVERRTPPDGGRLLATA